MTTNGNAIATVGDIRRNFGITLRTDDSYCPTYSIITADASLGVSGGDYESNQLVMYKHIYKKTVAILTVTDWKEFMEEIGEDSTSDGTWVFAYGNSSDIMDYCEDPSFPESGLYYFDSEPLEKECQITGTTAQWQYLDNYVAEWDNVILYNVDSGRKITNIPNWDAIGEIVYRNLRNGISSEIDFGNNWNPNPDPNPDPDTPTVRTCTIPIYFTELNYVSFSELDTFVDINIKSNNGTNYTVTGKHITGGYANTSHYNEYVHICDIVIQYTGTTFNNNVDINFIFRNLSTHLGTTVRFGEYFNSTYHRGTTGYAFDEEVIGSSSEVFNNQWWKLSDIARTASDYKVVLGFTFP